MRSLYVSLLIILICSVSISAQENSSNYLLIEKTAVLQLPADLILFNVNLSAEDIEPKSAFGKHKREEKALLELLGGLNIPDSAVTYSLLRISGSGYRKGEPKKYATNQRVSFLLDDFKMYETVQISLLEADITNFNSSFSLRDSESARWKALEKAIRESKIEAETIAENCGRGIGKVISIERTSNISFPSEGSFSEAFDAKAGLIEIPQFVKVSAYVKIKYELID